MMHEKRAGHTPATLTNMALLVQKLRGVAELKNPDTHEDFSVSVALDTLALLKGLCAEAADVIEGTPPQTNVEGELLPCPFCGGKNLRFNLSDIEGWIAHVECTDCDDMIGPMSKYKHDDKADAEKDAAEVWNIRPPAPHLNVDSKPTTWGIFTNNGRFTNLVGEDKEDAKATGEEYFTTDFIIRPLYERSITLADMIEQCAAIADEYAANNQGDTPESLACHHVASGIAKHIRELDPMPPTKAAGVEDAIRRAGIKARDALLERMADEGTVDNDLADYLTRIVDACVRAAPAKAAPPKLWRWWFEAQGPSYTGEFVPTGVYHSEPVSPPPAVNTGDARRVQELEDALKNLMGAYDTPLSRRRFPPDDFMKESLSIARDVLAGSAEVAESRSPSAVADLTLDSGKMVAFYIDHLPDFTEGPAVGKTVFRDASRLGSVPVYADAPKKDTQT